MLRAGVIIVQQFLSRIMDLLCACPPGHVPCLAVTGAGGKSSLAAGLSIHLSKAGHSGIIAPSTRIYMPRPRSCSPEEAQRLAECGIQTCDALLLRRGRSDRALSEELRAVLYTMDGVPRRLLPLPEKSSALCPNRALCLVLGEEVVRHSPRSKLRGLSPETICRLKQFLEKEKLSRRAVLLVEADGAARHPLKAHAAHEPQIPSCADLVVAVMGLDALGKPLATVVHRPELAAERLGVTLYAPVTPRMAATLLLHEEGPFRGTPSSARRIVLLNKTDVLDPSQGKLLDELLESLHVPGGPDEILLHGNNA